MEIVKQEDKKNFLNLLFWFGWDSGKNTLKILKSDETFFAPPGLAFFWALQQSFS